MPWHLDPERQTELRNRLEEIFAAKPRDEWLALLEPLDACVGPVSDLAEAFADPQLRAREMFVEQQLSDGSTFTQLGVVPRLAATPGRVGGVASALGADTDDVLAGLGRTPDQIASLRADGVV